MNVQSISIQGNGHVFCKSNFYTAHDTLTNDNIYYFTDGINKLIGEIDDGIWAISYLLSMYHHNSDGYILYAEPAVYLNSQTFSLSELSNFSCYMDKSYPLFSQEQPVKTLIEIALHNNKLEYSAEEIRLMFNIDVARFQRPLSCVGNEIFRAMAAIGFCSGHEIFCFPWLSAKRFNYYSRNITDVLDVLASLGKTLIVPIGK